MKFVKVFVLLCLASSVMADGLMNKYRVHEYSEEEFVLDNASLTVGLAPTLSSEGGVSKRGTPFTLRIICKSRMEGECIFRLNEVKVTLDQKKHVLFR